LSAEPTNSPIRRIVEQAFNQGVLTVVDELLAPDGITHIPSWGIPHTREGLKQLIALFRSAFPDMRCIVEDEISVGDRVAAHWMLRGTQTGLFHLWKAAAPFELSVSRCVLVTASAWARSAPTCGANHTAGGGTRTDRRRV
jgi:hypothetical protein